MSGFKIMGQYMDLPKEEIDTADTQEEAEELLDEYAMAFGQGWVLWIG